MPIENIRRDLNKRLSSDLWEKFIELGRNLNLLKKDLIMGITDGVRRKSEIWEETLLQINETIKIREDNGIQGKV